MHLPLRRVHLRGGNLAITGHSVLPESGSRSIIAKPCCSRHAAGPAEWGYHGRTGGIPGLLRSLSGGRSTLRRINSAETGLSPRQHHLMRHNPYSRRWFMTEPSAAPPRPTVFKKGRGAALAFALGATIALPPLVWAQNPPTSSAAPEQTAPIMAQQSFAPLVKKVLPAVVNISVTEKSDIQGLAERLPEQFRGSPFDDFLRRFFEQHGSEGQVMPRPFRGSPDERGSGRGIALGSGLIDR